MNQKLKEHVNPGGNGEKKKEPNMEDAPEERISFKKEESPGLGKEVKSTAIVKYSTVGAPATFTRLCCNTNLNLPPSNWLSSSTESYGLRAASFFHKSDFSSFQMAHMFPDCIGEVDVVSDAENIKKLLKIPYRHGPVSMMIHRIKNTLLIDEFDVHKHLLRGAECQWDWFKKFFLENVMQSNAKDKIVRHRDNSRNALQQKSLVSKFLYHSLVVADSSQEKLPKSDLPEVDPSMPIPLPYKSDLPEVDPSVPIPLPYKSDPTMPIPLSYKSDPPLPDPTLEEELPDPTSNHKFARNVVWTFEDIQMLLGTDMPIFGGGTHPCISLRLRDMAKPINVLTGMDYWLDNLMCNVPEVVMCYHLNGIVQKYELIKTEDLPNLENSKFSPKVIRDIAQNILSFLKANATKAGHTYWLFKGKDDDVVKLYDLTSLCTDVMDEKGQTPFTVPVAMLLYRVARNMKNSSDGRRQSATIRMLLKNCLSLLSPEKYPEIVTSAHFMLSDLYIPVDINPSSPKFSNVDEQQEVEVEDRPRPDDENEAIKSLSIANISEIHMEEPEFVSPPPPLGTDVEGRCIDGIRHVIQGLRTLKFLHDEKEKPEAQEKEPEMANPFQAIPMPYQPLNEKEDEKKGKKKKKKKKKGVQPEEAKSLLWKPKAEAMPMWNSSTSKSTPSWNLHLKTLLFEKMCLIYVTLLERSYSEEKFGLTLHYLKMGFKTRKVLKSLPTDINSTDLERYLLGYAGDAFFMVVQNSKKMELLNKDYSSLTEFDVEALEEIKNEGVDVNEEVEGFPKKLENIEELLLAGRSCYKKNLEFGVNEKLLRRLGNIENELGVFYMNQAAEIFQQELITKEDVKGSFYEELFKKSFRHLESGIQAFDTVKDEANLALLYSNTGRLMRVESHFLSLMANDDKELELQERAHYRKSIFYYQKALQVLGERKYNPVIWDFVNWELSTALFSIATLLQDYPPIGISKEETEKEVTEALHKALKYCDVETPGVRQPVYQYKSAMIHHRLASLYHKSYRSSAEDETKKKKLHQLGKLHYEKSAKLLLLLENSSEYLRVQLERVALSEFLAEGSSSITTKIKHHEYALELLLEGEAILKIISERDLKFYDEEEEKKETESVLKNENKEEKNELEKKFNLENEMILLGFFEQRLQFNLLSLTKLHLNKNEGKKGSTSIGEIYKKLYATSLQAKCCKDNTVETAKYLLSIVSHISDILKSVTVAS